MWWGRGKREREREREKRIWKSAGRAPSKNASFTLTTEEKARKTLSQGMKNSQSG
jgi:hypothetical protein